MDVFSQLPNGLPLALHQRPQARTASVSLWLLAGSRYEGSRQPGFAHLLEHVLFAGTRRHTGRALLERLDDLGARCNAQTGREFLVLYGDTSAEHAPELLRLLVEMVTEPAFARPDVSREAQVLTLELKHAPDLEERLIADAWPDHPLGRQTGALPIGAGAPELHDYLAQARCAARIAVVCDGALDMDAVTDAAAALADLPAGERPPAVTPALRTGTRRLNTTAPPQLLWALQGPGRLQVEAAHWLLLRELLAGGQTALLRQALRGGTPLAYGYDCRFERFAEAGLLLLRTAGASGRASACGGAVERVFEYLVRQGADADELRRARTLLESRLDARVDQPLECLAQLAERAFWPQLPTEAALREVLAQLDGPALARTLAQAPHRTLWAGAG